MVLKHVQGLQTRFARNASREHASHQAGLSYPPRSSFVSRKTSAFASIGAPLGALAVIAGCSGGGSVVRTITAPASPIAGHPAGPTVPVTIVVNPSRRAAATHRSGIASRRTSGLSATLKIGITVYDPLVSVTAPPESVSATPITRPGLGTPIPHYDERAAQFDRRYHHRPRI